MDSAVIASEMSPRTRRLLQGAILPTLLRMAWPNVLVMTAQASTGLIETWWVSHLGTDALAGMALVFPGFMMMTMLSGGAVGGGIASAVARALGGGRRAGWGRPGDACFGGDLVLGLLSSALFLGFGRRLYAAMGGEGGVAGGCVGLLERRVRRGGRGVGEMNALASVVRGTGNMLVPSLTVCLGVVLLVPLSPLLIFGVGARAGDGHRGGRHGDPRHVAALDAGAGVVCAVRAVRVVRPRDLRLRWPLFADILRVGLVAGITTLQTTFTVALTTAIVGINGGPDAVAGYGTGARLEYLLIPLVFGLGAPMVALVGTNIGAGQQRRALRIALTGGALAFGVAETIGLAAAAWPEAWLRLFGSDPAMLATGTAYLRVVGPAYGFFGLGLSLYFASQGAGRLAWPLLAGLARLVIAVVGGWAILRATGSLGWLFGMLAAALVVYGATIAMAVASGTWFRSALAR